MVNRSHRSSMLLKSSIGFASTLAFASLLGGCTIDGIAILPGLDSDDAADESGSSHDDGTDTQGNDADEGGDSLDLPNDEEGGASEFEQACTVLDEDLDAALPCAAQAPSDHLAPVVAWTWTGPGGEDSVLVTPLVGNLDDDNLDGEIDPCDRPDLLVLAVNAPASSKDQLPAGHLYVLDSVSGETKWMIDRPIDPTATPAIADLDDDGVVEILVFERSVDLIGQFGERRVVALQADGTDVWVSDTWVPSGGGGALAIADLDVDGSPEILAPEHVLTADGVLLWAPPGDTLTDSLPIAANLVDDSKLEVLFGRSIYAHDGTELVELALPGNKNAGVSAIANFDDDPQPEIYVHSGSHRIFEHDGTPKVQCGDGNGKNLPISIVDTNSDGRAEILSTRNGTFQARTVTVPNNGGTGEPSCEVLWSVKVSDGNASAFDFLADGGVEAIYSDLDWVRIYDPSGTPIVEFERPARTSMASPVVADADNDGSAELIIVGSEPEGGDVDGGLMPRASVIYIENDDDRFAPTRRIWNQHAYHATNIREDARVPVEQEPHWIGANGFRTNPAPSYSGDSCQISPLP
jgi:hypothetical protein